MPSSDDKPNNLKPPPATENAVAVALHQERETDRAPKVVAHGRGRIAEQILEIAFAQGIKVREDADLAQLLSAVEADQEIPTEAFAAVAEILVYLYQANGEAPPGAEDGSAAAGVQQLAADLAAKWQEGAEGSK